MSTKRAKDGRHLVRADSRPIGYITNFTCRGDTAAVGSAPGIIGNGKVLAWDFANSNDDATDDGLTSPIPTNYKRKRIEIGFIEVIYIKEGAIYFFDAKKGSYLDLYIVCKNGGYYKDPNGATPASALSLPGDDMYTQATQDTPVIHYVNHHRIQGDVPMGDELNTEGASEDGLPPMANEYYIWVEVTVPSSDVDSNGNAELELYRKRTILLPNEAP